MYIHYSKSLNMLPAIFQLTKHDSLSCAKINKQTKPEKKKYIQSAKQIKVLAMQHLPSFILVH